jgi:hypothetical protein
LAQGDSTHRIGGTARGKAREFVQHQAAQKELQEKLTRIEILKTVAGKRFKRLNNAILLSAFWGLLLCVAFGAVVWYWNDFVSWVDGMMFSKPPAKP